MVTRLTPRSAAVAPAPRAPRAPRASRPPTLAAELKRLRETLADEPRDNVIPIVRYLQQVADRLATERATDSALLDALMPAEIPAPPRLLQVRRNADARRQLIDGHGLFSSAELAELRDADTANPSVVPGRWLRERRIFDVPPLGDRRFPGFQFDPSGRPRPVIRDILAAMGEVLRGWELALWFTGSNAALDGDRPVDRLDRDPAAVVAAAAYEVAKAQGD